METTAPPAAPTDVRPGGDFELVCAALNGALGLLTLAGGLVLLGLAEPRAAGSGPAVWSGLGCLGGALPLLAGGTLTWFGVRARDSGGGRARVRVGLLLAATGAAILGTLVIVATVRDLVAGGPPPRTLKDQSWTLMFLVWAAAGGNAIAWMRSLIPERP